MSLIDDIRALPAEVVADRDPVAIAAALAPRLSIVRCEIGKGRILATLGMEAGNQLLDVIDSNADFRHVKQLVTNGWLDIGDPMTRATLDALVPQVLSAEQAAALKALAEVTTPVDEFDVRRACWSDEGEWQV